MKGSLAEVRRYALRLLNYRSRSRKEMLERLGKKGFDQDHITHVMDFLEKADLLNDEILASDLFRQSTERRYLGSRGVRMFLAKRGIPKDLIDKTMSDHTTEMEEVSALKCIEKKIGSLIRKPDHVKKRRLWGMLERRGYSGSVINRALRKVNL
ncbi:MAG: regulatory protein RecX [Nitrospiraceae bacterium]|nr:MAG: regulatory protein RecX [Nitrospiraceae bacterium]